MIKFNKFNIVDTETKLKARVYYSLDSNIHHPKCVTLYAKDYTNGMHKIFTPDVYRNDTDIRTDYFEKGRVLLLPDHPLYAAARLGAERSRK